MNQKVILNIVTGQDFKNKFTKLMKTVAKRIEYAVMDGVEDTLYHTMTSELDSVSVTGRTVMSLKRIRNRNRLHQRKFVSINDGEGAILLEKGEMASVYSARGYPKFVYLSDNPGLVDWLDTRAGDGSLRPGFYDNVMKAGGLRIGDIHIHSGGRYGSSFGRKKWFTASVSKKRIRGTLKNRIKNRLNNIKINV